MLTTLFRKSNNFLKLSLRTASKSLSSKAPSNVSTVDSVPAHTSELFLEADVKRFRSRLPQLIQAMIDDNPEISLITENLTGQLNLILPNDMIVEGLKTAYLHKCMTEFTGHKCKEQTKNADILGWCADLFLVTLEINDDIMEDSKTRWGKPSFHANLEIGMHALGYSVVFENLIYFYLKKYFSDKYWYKACLETFHNVILKTYLGQSIDPSLRQDGKLVFKHLTPENYRTYMSHKMTFGLVTLPMMLAQFAAENYDLNFPVKARPILNELGWYLGVQDDIVDHLEDRVPSETDSAKGNFTWLLMQALKKGSPSQKQAIEQNYGLENPQSVNIIKEIYEDLKLLDLYQDHKSKSLEFVQSETLKAPISDVHKEMIMRYSQMFY